MKPNIIHSIVVCLAAFTLPFMVACRREESLPEEISEAILYLNIEPVGLTRAGTAGLPDNEKMHSVRVIVLHNDGKVEHNRHFSLENALAEKTILLKVTPNEKKKIFLFANEKSVSSVEGVTVEGENKTLTAFFNSYTEGMSGFEDEVNELYFAPDYSVEEPIPMSSMYEIDFKEGREDYQFYLVRAATKFTMNFMNWRGEEVTVENFSIESHADRNFLMAHVSSYPDTQNPETNQKYPTWIDWLKAVSDASNVDSDAATNRFGWLTDYRLPEQTTAKVYTHEGLKIGKPTVDIENPNNSKPGVANVVPVFYLPESKNLKQEGATIVGEQEYTLSINIAGRAEPFVCKLDKLKALFRNTHLVVNVTMYNSNEIVVDVIPYSEVILEPEFGL